MRYARYLLHLKVCDLQADAPHTRPLITTWLLLEIGIWRSTSYLPSTGRFYKTSKLRLRFVCFLLTYSDTQCSPCLDGRFRPSFRARCAVNAVRYLVVQFPHTRLSFSSGRISRHLPYTLISAPLSARAFPPQPNTIVRSCARIRRTYTQCVSYANINS